MIPTAYATKNRTLKYIKSKLIKLRVTYLNTHLLIIGRKNNVENKQGFSRVEQLY